MIEEKQTVSLWLSPRTHNRMLALQKKIEQLTGVPLTHESFIDTLLNYEQILLDAFSRGETT